MWLTVFVGVLAILVLLLALCVARLAHNLHRAFVQIEILNRESKKNTEDLQQLFTELSLKPSRLRRQLESLLPRD